MNDSSYLVLFFEPIRAFLEDDTVSEVMINGANQIYVERRGKLELTNARFPSEAAVKAAAVNVAKHVGRMLNNENPRLDARLPDGSRVHAVIPPLSRQGTVVAIRRFRAKPFTIDDLIACGSICDWGARLLDTIVKVGKNMIVSGATSSGKTSVLNVLSSYIPEYERILVLEDASELQLQQDHAVYMETRAADKHGKHAVPIRDLIHSALRLRPDRLVIGEIRGGEALDLLQAMNTGHGGSMSTIHANSAVDALSRLETCALLSGVELPMHALRSQVGSAIDVVVHTNRLNDGSRRIVGISEILGVNDGQYNTQELLRFDEATGTHQGRFIPSFFETAVRRGLPMERNWFAAA